MAEPENEQLVNYLVVLEHGDRLFTTEPDNHWGGLLTPSSDERSAKTDRGLRLALFGSWKFGYVVLETLKKIESMFPERLNLVGMVTDNPLNPDAKISKKKRIWNLLNLPIQVVDETCMIESGLGFGIPVYTGEIKIDSFRKLLTQWKPDVILVCVFGQIIDSFAINYPSRGIYNFHPSDLANHHGSGPSPYQDLKDRNADTGMWSVHKVIEELDAGPVVAQSPPVCVKDETGKLPENPLIVYDKLMEALSPFVYHFVLDLLRHFEENHSGQVDRIDLISAFSPELRSKLMKPVTRVEDDPQLPDPDSDLFYFI